MELSSFNRLAREYLSKCECCDECFAEIFCISENRREGRVSSKNEMKCVNNIKDYFESEEYFTKKKGM